MAVKQSTPEAQEELVDLINENKTTITLSNGKKVRVGYIIGETQDYLNKLIVKYEKTKQQLQNNENKYGKEETEQQLNALTRRFFAKCTAAILLNNIFLLKLFFHIKWRLLYYFANFTGDDYLNIIAIAKKKAQEPQFMMAMTLLMDMTTIWTTMSRKEAEQYRQELLLAKEAQSLKNSPT